MACETDQKPAPKGKEWLRVAAVSASVFVILSLIGAVSFWAAIAVAGGIAFGGLLLLRSI